MKKTIPLLLSISVLVLSSCGNNSTPEKYTGPNWINANIDGELKKYHERPELKDDFFSNVNYEEITSMDELPENVNAAGGLFTASDNATDAAVAKLLTEETSATYSSELLKIRNYLTDGDLNFLQNEFDWWMNGPNFFQIRDYFSQVHTNIFWNSIFDIDSFTYDLPILYPGGFTYGKLGIFYVMDSQLAYEYDPHQYAKYKGYQSAAEKGLKIIYSALGYEQTKVNSLVAQEIEIERKLTYAYMYSSQGYYTLSVGDTASIFNYYPMSRALSALGYDNDQRFYLTVSMYNYLKAIDQLTDEERNLFYGTRVLLSYPLCLGLETYKELNNEFFVKTELSDATLSIDNEVIMRYLAEVYFTQFIDVSYSEVYSSATVKAQVMSLIGDVINEYRSMLSEEEWLSEETKEKAIEKIDYMTYDAMYPNIYSEFTFASETTSLSDFCTKYLNSKYQNIQNNNVHPLWQSSPTYTCNAFFAYGYNRFQLYQGLYQAFDFEHASVEELYSQVAMVIGHEITHGFDANGSQYDKYGNYYNWWTPEDQQRFNTKVDKVVKYFSNIKLKKGVYCNGELVNTEATADMGGMKVAIRLAKKVNGFDYQKFFESYAKVFSLVINKNKFNDYINDEHPLSYLRVNVTVAQFDEFIQAYNIQEGDGMYVAPEDRITVW